MLLGPLIVLAPVNRFLRVGWLIKRSEIIEGFSKEACKKHFRMFQPTKAFDPPDPFEALDCMYRRWYGPRLFIWPIILLFGVSVVASLVGTTSACQLIHCKLDVYSLIAVPRTALAALAGGYVFVVHDFITRARRLDFMPSDVHWGTLRLTAAIPIGYSFAAMPTVYGAVLPSGLAAGTADFIAFAAAAFPLETVQRITRRYFIPVSGVSDPQNPNDDDIIRLQGINTDIATRLAHEDISTITQMAYCDPIRLTMRSGLTFNFVVDCMSQALAWEYLEEDMNVIRRYGLRGAVELSHLMKRLNSKSYFERMNAELLLLRIVETLNANGKSPQTRQTMRFVLEELATDPFTSYIESVWTGIRPQFCWEPENPNPPDRTQHCPYAGRNRKATRTYIYVTTGGP